MLAGVQLRQQALPPRGGGVHRGDVLMQGDGAGAEVVEQRPVELASAAEECDAVVGLLVERAAAWEVVLAHRVGLLGGFQSQRLFDCVPQRERLFEDKANVDAAVVLQPFQHGGQCLVVGKAAPTVAEAGHAVTVEADAQVEASRAGCKLFIYGFALAPGEGEHEPVPPPAGRQVAHGVVGADDCFKCRLFHIVSPFVFVVILSCLFCQSGEPQHRRQAVYPCHVVGGCGF